MRYSLILGGTKGLGRSLAQESAARGILPIAAGRSADEPGISASLPEGAIRLGLELTDDASIEKAVSAATQYPVEYFFWNAGMWLGRKPFRELSPSDIGTLMAANVIGPLKALHQFHATSLAKKQPYHLVITSSASAWLIRKNETVYCASKDAQAVFALNFADELAEDLPGSKTTIFYPGGMKTEIFGSNVQDTTGYMEPDAVAKAMWDEILNQKEKCKEVHIIRDKKKNDGSFTIEYGPRPRGVR